MDPARTRAIVRTTAAAMALGLVVAGCGKDDSSSSSESSSVTSSASATSSATSAAPTPAATPNYESLLMKPEDLPQIPTGSWTADAPTVTLTPPPPDVSQTYSSGTNAISASIIITDDAAQAATRSAGPRTALPPR